MNERQFADRIGNIDGRLVEGTSRLRRKGSGGPRRILAAAAVAALMAVSFTAGALAFAREAPTIELPEIGLTLILPDSWKDLYGVEVNEGVTWVYVKPIREKDPVWGGTLFYVDRSYDRPMTPEELYDISPVPCRYLFSTEKGTYSINYASDVQWNTEDPDQDALYHRMMSESEQIRFIVDGVLSNG